MQRVSNEFNSGRATRNSIPNLGYEVHTQIKRDDDPESHLPSYRSKWIIYKAAIPMCFPNFIMGLNWSIFNQTFHTINNAINLNGDWEESIFYGSINGLFIFGCLIGTLAIPALLRKPKGVALEDKTDHAWYGQSNIEGSGEIKPEADLPGDSESGICDSKQFYFEMKERKESLENKDLVRNAGSLEIDCK
jgi:hypothetical protein